MAVEKHRYIVVEGPIGAGKTSLARRLAGHFGKELMLEDPDSNPFLARFYDDPRRHALATQLFFLFQRVQQVGGLKQIDLFDRGTVADFILDKDPLFASLTLSDDELHLYQQIYSHLMPQAPTPDLVDLPAGFAGHAGRARAQARRCLRTQYLRAISGAPCRRIQPLLLPVLRRAAADREQRPPEFC